MKFIIRELYLERMSIFVMGAASGVLLTILGTWVAFKCLEWRGLW